MPYLSNFVVQDSQVNYDLESLPFYEVIRSSKSPVNLLGFHILFPPFGTFSCTFLSKPWQ